MGKCNHFWELDLETLHEYPPSWTCTFCNEKERHAIPILDLESIFNEEKPVTATNKPIQAGDSHGAQFLCPSCDFPKNDTLSLEMKYCFNCGTKLDWSDFNKEDK